MLFWSSYLSGNAVTHTAIASVGLWHIYATLPLARWISGSLGYNSAAFVARSIAAFWSEETSEVEYLA